MVLQMCSPVYIINSRTARATQSSITAQASNLSTWDVEEEDKEFKVILVYIASPWPA